MSEGSRRYFEPWTLVYEGWAPEREPLREALCTLGNGYFATRGAAEEASAGGPHYPGTYIAGGYDRLETKVADRVVENEDLVNWPSWLPLTFRPENGEWLDPSAMRVHSLRQELDVRRGVLRRELEVEDPGGRRTRLHARRLVSMCDPHLAAIEWQLTPQNWSGRLHVRTGLDGTVTNAGVERYRQLDGRHLRALETGQAGEDGVYLVVESVQSRMRVAVAARTRVLGDAGTVAVDRRLVQQPAWVGQRLELEATQGHAIRVEKVAALYTGRDRGISEPALEARHAAAEAGSFEELLARHVRSWSRLWHRADMRIMDEDTLQVLRLHTFHLLQTVSLNTVDLDTGVPARGWHGEAYRGHIFWDELFILPFLTLRMPELTRGALLYRYRRLPEARRAARDAGYEGAMFPWQSGSSGREESQSLHLNPKSGRWIPDETQLQRHINAAIAFNVWHYHQATGSKQFLGFFGAELLLEIARFWASIARYDATRGRYVIRGVVGPDEYHTRHPGADEPGLSNNAYTNVMAAWCIRTALNALDELPGHRKRELREALGIDDDVLQRFRDVVRRMYVPIRDDGIIEQFDGWSELQELDWDGYRERYGDIQRLDRILEAEGDTPNRYQASKQADVLMLLYLLSAEQLSELFEAMGYAFDPQMIPANIDYYRRRTSHGSTLSRVVHSWVLARSDRPASHALFCEALESDVADIQGGTTHEGIHLGAMAGTVDILQRCYAGVEVRDDVLWLNPQLPEAIAQVDMMLRFRACWLDLTVRSRRLTVRSHGGWQPAVRVGVGDEVRTMHPGDEWEVQLRPRLDAEP